MKKISLVILMVLTTIIVSCGPAVTTKKTANVDLSTYNSFAYLPNADVEMPQKSQNDEINSILLQEINNNMLKAGYTLDRDNPDLLVLVSAKVSEETEVDRDPVYASYGFYDRTNLAVSPTYNNYYYRSYNVYPTVVGYDTDTYEYKEGTVIIQLVDRETKRTVWKGTSTNSIYDSATVSELERLIRAIFMEYPLVSK